jgi:sulfur relay protein TusB/DsrH
VEPQQATTVVLTSKSLQDIAQWQTLERLIRELVRMGSVAVVAWGDAVYLATAGRPEQPWLQTWPVQFYVLRPDLAARGLSPYCSDWAIPVDYSDVVDLIFGAKRTVSWT